MASGHEAQLPKRKWVTGRCTIGICLLVAGCLLDVANVAADIVCTTLWDPVCGCNGQTYSNSCVATKAGVTCIAYPGACGFTPPDTVISQAPPASTSNTGATFSFTSTEAISNFSCQLDGSTWSNCNSPIVYTGLAAGNHTFSVRARDMDGHIDPTPAMYAWTVVVPPTACITDVECGVGYYCSKPTGNCTGSGICEAWNPGGYCFMVYDPACGCNGLTYGNICEAAKAGVSIAYIGACGSGVARVSQNPYRTLADAYSASCDGNTLELKNMELVEDVVFDRPLAIVLQGGCDSEFANCNGMTVIRGSIVIAAGSVTIENLTVM